MVSEIDVIDTIITSSRASNGTGRLNRAMSVAFPDIFKRGKCAPAQWQNRDKLVCQVGEGSLNMMPVHRTAQSSARGDDCSIDFLPG
jgi:hypothetical protein